MHHVLVRQEGDSLHGDDSDQNDEGVMQHVCSGSTPGGVTTTHYRTSFERSRLPSESTTSQQFLHVVLGFVQTGSLFVHGLQALIQFGLNLGV